MGMAIKVMIIGGDGAVRAFAGPVGEGIADEGELEDGLHASAQRMMLDAVAEGRPNLRPGPPAKTKKDKRGKVVKI